MRNFILFALLTMITNINWLESAPAQIMLIRSAENKPQGNSLTTRGKIRVAAYAPYFMETPELIKHGVPAAIYAMHPSDANPSELPIETVRHVAYFLNLTINEKYDRNDFRSMVDDILANASYDGKNILICWDYTLLSEIARAFKAFQSPNRWQPEIFDRVWVINLGTAGKVTFQNLPQRLLFGDTQN